MNKKQLAYLQSILTPEQFTTFSGMKQTREKKVEKPDEKVKELVEKVKCCALKKDKSNCTKFSKQNEKFCGIHLNVNRKLADRLTQSVPVM